MNGFKAIKPPNFAIMEVKPVKRMDTNAAFKRTSSLTWVFFYLIVV